MSDETIGELHDRLPADEWVDLPEFGVRVRRWPDPAPPTASEPTSAKLRETMTALAASQADLTAMEAKHNAWISDFRAMRTERDEALVKLAQPCGSCHPCDAHGAQQDRDLARAELVSAQAEMDRLKRYVATLERALSGADDAIERLRGES